MERRRALEQNIWKHYLYCFISNLRFTHGVWMIYLSSLGFSLTELGLVEGLFHIVSFSMEVPTGAVADIWGRRVSRIVSRVLRIIGLALILSAHSFAVIAVGFACEALSYTFESGAGEALLFDSMKELGTEKKFKKAMGKVEFLFQLSIIAALFIGGYLAVFSYSLVYGASIVATLIALLIAWSMVEPEVEDRLISDQGSIWEKTISSLRSQTVGALQTVRQTPIVAMLIVFSTSIDAFWITLFFYLQPFLKNSGYNEAQIGIVFVAYHAAAGLAGLAAPWVEKKLGMKPLLRALPLLLLCCLWGITAAFYSTVWFVIGGILDGVLYVVVQDWINQRIPSNQRATILSYQSMAFSMIMLVLFPALGRISDIFSQQIAFSCLAALGTLLTIYFFWFLQRRRVFED